MANVRTGEHLALFFSGCSHWILGQVAGIKR